MPRGRGFFFFTGIAVLACSAAVPFRFYQKYRFWTAAGFLLLLLLLPVFGTRIHGMCGWIRFGTFSIQPTELAKPVFVVGLAGILSSPIPEWRRFVRTVLFAACGIGAVVLQPDLGTAAVYFAVFVLMLFISGFKLRYIAGMLSVGVAGTAVFLLMHPYALKRITGLMGMSDNWHIRQFELAAARGGWFGSKIGHAYWSNSYLPLPYNDSAYASLFETIGFAGAIMVLVLYALLAASLGMLALRQKRTPDAALCIAGAALLTGAQSLLHIGVNLSILPPTGLTLPLVSYGGSSFIGCCLLLGIALSAATPQKEA